MSHSKMSIWTDSLLPLMIKTVCLTTVSLTKTKKNKQGP